MRSFGCFTGGRPLDSAFWRFFTAMIFSGLTVTCLDVDGEKSYAPRKDRSAHGAPYATSLAYRAPPIHIESSPLIFLRFLSLTTATHRRNGTQGSTQEYVQYQSPAIDRATSMRTAKILHHGNCRTPGTVLHCSECASISPSTKSLKFLNIANTLQPPPRPASRPMPPLRLPFVV